MDVSIWLRDLGLLDYVQAFRANDIDAEVLPRLTAEDLIALGVMPATCSPRSAADHPIPPIRATTRLLSTRWRGSASNNGHT